MAEDTSPSDGIGGEVYHIKQFNIDESEQLILDRGQTLTITEDCLLIFREGKWKVYDDKTGLWVEKNFYNKAYLQRLAVINIQVYFNNEFRKWVLEIDNWYFVFEERKECEQLFNRLVKWKREH